MLCRLLLFFLCLCAAPVAAQQAYEWQATVPSPAQGGYHRILLPPEVTGRLQPHLGDIRLYNAQQQEVPYLLQKEQPLTYRQLYRPYTILHYKRQSGCCSELLIENPEQRQISNLSLLIKNAAVRKQVSLSGSDDRENWFVLKAQDVLHPINSTEKTTTLKLLEFPLNDYRYLRLQLDDSSSAPLNILQAGSYYGTQTANGAYTLIPVQQTTRTDSAATEQTYIHLKFAHPVYPELLELDITAPELYFRNGHIILGKATTPSRKRRRKRDREELVQVPFSISSKEAARITLPRRQMQELTLVVENADNPPLEIAAIRVLQLNRYLVANLEAGTPYILRFGNAETTAPTYDLTFFRDSIPNELPVLPVKQVDAVQERQKPQGSSSKVWLWVAIGIVVLGLGYMTVRLLNEMNSKKQP
ncbi:DUF3999 family protein [Pontibacter akesuensis]|uniref:DUF3999 domain-containing protein n=1 Tax=Pontibacter akesuensis TaxID=388950 RepID=A0A1I7K8Y6_9BACT|nr:DUF3999 family protein [Pontibacter akesuensis]GHA74192.1 hypothetical protein GCM10007389_29810 [Pontibacter akesuensis]SFU93850.1 Protein of unknown function [Pontibacter akesuensis]